MITIVENVLAIQIHLQDLKNTSQLDTSKDQEPSNKTKKPQVHHLLWYHDNKCGQNSDIKYQEELVTTEQTAHVTK